MSMRLTPVALSLTDTSLNCYGAFLAFRASMREREVEVWSGLAGEVLLRSVSSGRC